MTVGSKLPLAQAQGPIEASPDQPLPLLQPR